MINRISCEHPDRDYEDVKQSVIRVLFMLPVITALGLAVDKKW